jgi:hypothetical protein
VSCFVARFCLAKVAQELACRLVSKMESGTKFPVDDWRAQEFVICCFSAGRRGRQGCPRPKNRTGDLTSTGAKNADSPPQTGAAAPGAVDPIGGSIL